MCIRDRPWSDKSYDAVLASGVLLCIGPSEIESALMEIIRVAKHKVILVEPFEDSPLLGNTQGRQEHFSNTDYWIRNLPLLLSQFVSFNVESVEHLGDKSMGHMNSITVISLD